MLGGLEAYGSDDSDSDAQQVPSSSTVSATPRKPAHTLPSLTKALPKAKSKRPVFTVAKSSKTSLSDDDSDGRARLAKKARLEGRVGAGSSSLLAMLPAPSKHAAEHAAPRRVLGSASQGGGTGVVMSPFIDTPPRGGDSDDLLEQGAREDKSTTLLPPSLAKGKIVSADKRPKPPSSPPALDFFSIGTASSRNTSIASTSNVKESESPSSSATVTSAPTVPTFEPPTPTPLDPYPGYYQLPSGQWAAYEPEFYRKHYDIWTASVNLDGTSHKGFEGAEDNDTVEIDAQDQLDLARKEREEKKALTRDANGGPKAPNMNIKAPKIGSRARTRHQLSALLTEAYENREALEERIAQGRRNRKEAGNKYGF